MLKDGFLKWCSFSLLGHIVLFELAIAIPVFLGLSLLLAYLGTMTLRGELYTLTACVLGGATVGLLTWFAVTRPLIKRKL